MPLPPQAPQQFIPVQVSDFVAWGKLIMSWATGQNYMTGDGTAAFGTPLNPANPATFSDGTAIRMTLANFNGAVAAASTVTVTYPPTVTEIVIVRDTPTRRYVRLPDPDMTAAAYKQLSTSDGSYNLPTFYIASPLFAHDPAGHGGSYPKFTTDQQLTLQAERVGDYSISSCA